MFYPRSLQTSSKRSRPKDEDTYVLTIDIVKGSGSDSRQTTDVVPALALFNASSEHSWISKRFAEQLGIITQERTAEDGGFAESVKLAWKCSALGRYVQRTVFMIALLANFDVLFAEQRDENCRPSDGDQFQLGIQKGLLKRVAQKGIADGTMLRVLQNPSGESADAASVMPTLAQLEAQLLHDTEGHQNYHRKHSCNIRSVHSARGLSCCRLLDPERRKSTTPANENISERYITGKNGSEKSLCRDEGAIYPVKRTKLNSDSTTLGECESFKTDSVTQARESTLSSSSSSCSQSREPLETSTHLETVSARSVTDTFGSQATLDENSTRREVGCKSSAQRRNPRLRRQGAANSVSRGGSKPYVGTASQEMTYFTNRTSPDSSSETDTTNSDPLDPDYWTWDEAEQKYYHIDKASNDKLWYEAPP